MVAWAPLIAGGAAIASSLFNRKKKPKKLSTMDKRQQALWGDFEQGLQGRGQFADLFSYNPEQAQQNFQANVARPAYENFQENVIPGITGSFRGQGLGNSTYAGQALERGGRMMQNDLNAKMADYMFNLENSLRDRKTNALGNYFNTSTFDYQKPQQGWFDSALMGAANKFGGQFGDYAFNQLFPK